MYVHAPAVGCTLLEIVEICLESSILLNLNLDIQHKLAGRNRAREAGEISVARSAESNNLLRIYLTDEAANAP